MYTMRLFVFASLVATARGLQYSGARGNATDRTLGNATDRTLGDGGVPQWRENKPAGNATNSDKKLMLAFWAVGSSQAAMDLVRKDVAKLRATWGDNAEVYLAHYDMKRDQWLSNKADREWYDKNVQYSAERKGFKFQIMQALFKDSVDEGKYEWIWALDEDVDFSDTDISKMINLARQSKASITLPAFTQSGLREGKDKLAHSYQSPDPSCLYRYSEIVENIFPIFRPQALWPVLYECHNCIHEETAWGLCRVWCNFAAKKLHQQRGKTCAIIDKTPVVHTNLKTLTEKYPGKGGAEDTQFRWQAKRDSNDVKANHPNEFVSTEPADLKTECVRDPAGGKWGRWKNAFK